MRNRTCVRILGSLGLALVLAAGVADAGLRDRLRTFAAGPAAAIVALGPERVATTSGGRLELLDLAEPDSPTLLAALELDGAITAVDVAGDVLWATTDTPRLAAIDIADPTHPQLLATRRLPSYPYHVATDSDRVAVSADRYVLMFGFRPAGGISLDGVVGNSSDGYPGGIDLVGDLLYLGAYDTRQLEVWDVSTVPHPVRLGAVAVSQPSGPVEVAGTVAAVKGYGIDLVVFGDDGGSVGVLEVGPEGPELRGAIDLVPGDPADHTPVLVAAADDRAVAVHADAVSVLDLTDPATPEEAARLAAVGSPTGAILDGGLAYLSVGTELLVADVAVPADAAIVGSVDHGLNALGFALGDGWAAVTGVYSGATGHLTLIDLTVPADPQVLSSVSFDHQCHGVAVQGDLIVIAAEDAGLILVDASRPASPEILGTIPVADTAPAGGVWLDGGIAWVSGGYGATCPLRRIDLRDPAAPRDLGCAAGLSATDMAFADDRLAIARGVAGIAVGPHTFAVRPVVAAVRDQVEE